MLSMFCSQLQVKMILSREGLEERGSELDQSSEKWPLGAEKYERMCSKLDCALSEARDILGN